MQLFKHIQRPSRPLLALSILVAYLISLLSLVFESNHSHDFNPGMCKEDHHLQNVDQCHLRLDHHDLVNGCKHSEHISHTKPHCLLCDLLLHFDFAIVSIDFYCSIDTYFECTPFQLDSYPITSLIGLHNKAPPLVFS